MGYGPGDPPPGGAEVFGGPVALDTAHGRIFLCDSANNRVLVYGYSSQSGLTGTAPLAVFGQVDANRTAVNGMDTTTANGCGLAYPTGIAYDRNRDWFAVADTSNNRIQILRIPDSGGSILAPAIGAFRLPMCLFCIPWLLWLAAIIYSVLRRRRQNEEPAEPEDESAPEGASA